MKDKTKLPSFLGADDYQNMAERTLIKNPGFEIRPELEMIIWNALGLAGEAGEVANIIKKGIYHQHGLDFELIKKELGDCLWYISSLACEFNLNLSEIMQANIEKLLIRYPNGFNSTDSINRKDKEEII